MCCTTVVWYIYSDPENGTTRDRGILKRIGFSRSDPKIFLLSWVHMMTAVSIVGNRDREVETREVEEREVEVE